MKLVTSLVALVVLLGVSVYGVAAVSPPDEIGTISGTIAHDEYIEIGTLDFDEGKEVYMHLVVEDLYPELDLDLEIYGPNWELVWASGWGYNYGDSPEIIEEGFFWIPQSGTHYIWLYGYWIPDENGDPVGSCEYVLNYEVGDNLIDPVPVQSSGAKYGQLMSYIHSSPIAKMMASDKAAFAAVPEMYEQTVINAVGACQAQAWSAYALPGLVTCAEDPHIVGGQEWMLPLDWFSNYQEAKQFMGARDFKTYIEDVETGTITALSDLTDTKTGSVMKVNHAGERIGYSKIFEYGLFQPGELAALIGTGQKHLLCYWTIDGEIMFLYFDFYFWLLSEGTMGPG
jgi:hypothetical protein